MEFKKSKNSFGWYDIKLTDNEKELSIYYSPNFDLYMSATNGQRLKTDDDDYIYFDIYKKDYRIYQAIDNLYRNVYQKAKKEKIKLLDEDNNIIWVSDSGRLETEDSLLIYKYDECYRLLFFRNNNYDRKFGNKHKNARKIDIRFGNSGSRYKGYVAFFMNMHGELQNIENPKVYKK